MAFDFERVAPKQMRLKVLLDNDANQVWVGIG
jgi:hypothetical protein